MTVQKSVPRGSEHTLMVRMTAAFGRHFLWKRVAQTVLHSLSQRQPRDVNDMRGARSMWSPET
jgi:hypothetical protein